MDTTQRTGPSARISSDIGASVTTAQAVAVTVDVVIPVLNEAHVLKKSVNTVRQYLSETFPYRWQVVIVDNGSNDGTQQVAQRLSSLYSDVQFHYLRERGRGRALRHAWTA